MSDVHRSKIHQDLELLEVCINVHYMFVYNFLLLILTFQCVLSCMKS